MALLLVCCSYAPLKDQEMLQKKKINHGWLIRNNQLYIKKGNKERIFLSSPEPNIIHILRRSTTEMGMMVFPLLFGLMYELIVMY